MLPRELDRGAVCFDDGTDVLAHFTHEFRGDRDKALITAVEQQAVYFVGEISLIIDLAQCLGDLGPVQLA